MFRRFAAGLLLGLVLSAASGAAIAAPADTTKDGAKPPPKTESATDLVAGLQKKLLSVMKRAKKLGFEGRRKELDPVIRETHYIAAIARLTVSRYWNTLTQDQQKLLVQTFGDLSVANYASKFDGYSGEQFAQIDEKKSGKSTIVRTTITKTNGKKHTLDYTLRSVNGKWRILNITADGVSDLATKKAEYGSVMGKGGFNALIAKLREQIKRYESGG